MVLLLHNNVPMLLVDTFVIPWRFQGGQEVGMLLGVHRGWLLGNHVSI